MFDGFDVFAVAPNGVKKLRELILQLAVQGKLVPQDPNDEPASVLQKKIAAERARLVAEGKIKKSEPLPGIKPEEVPFDLPLGWEWVRLGTTSTFINGDRSKNYPSRASFSDAGMAFINAGHLKNRLVDYSEMNFIPKTVFDKLKSGKTRSGDILFCLRGSLGKVGCVDSDRPAAVASSLVIVRSLMRGIEPYLMQYFSSPLNGQMVRRHDNGSAQPNLSANNLRMFLLPLPPLAEQHRIVARVDQLMSLCDELEAKYNAQQDQRQKLNAAALDTLLAAEDETGFAAAWQRVCDGFDLLYDAPESVTKLRQALLQLAVMGKLVKQDPSDEPAPPRAMGSSRKYDTRLFEELKESVPIPDRWPVEPLGQLAEAIVDCPHSTPKWTREGRICVRTSQFRPGHLELADSRFVSEATYLERIQRLVPREDDILYSREGGILGVACRVPAGAQICLGQRMMLIRPSTRTDASFLELVLNSPAVTEIARRKTTGGAAPRVNVATVMAYPVPVPTLGEQHRIVAKVDQLMSLCDELEAKLTAARERAERLVGASVVMSKNIDGKEMSLLT